MILIMPGNLVNFGFQSLNSCFAVDIIKVGAGFVMQTSPIDEVSSLVASSRVIISMCALFNDLGFVKHNEVYRIGDEAQPVSFAMQTHRHFRVGTRSN